MPATVGSGTQAAIVGTEHTLDTETAFKTYVLSVNLVNMVDGDTVEIRIKNKVLTGDASAVEHLATFKNTQIRKIVSSIPVISEFELIATLKQTEGTARSFPWALRTID